MAPGLILAAGVAAIALAGRKSGGAKKPQTTGTATLKGGKSYRIELSVSGRAVNEAANPAHVAEGVRNGLMMNGAYDVYASPSNPILVSYSLDVPYDTPVVLGVAATQQIGGLPAEYVFRSVQQIAKRKAS